MSSWRAAWRDELLYPDADLALDVDQLSPCDLSSGNSKDDGFPETEAGFDDVSGSNGGPFTSRKRDAPDLDVHDDGRIQHDLIQIFFRPAHLRIVARSSRIRDVPSECDDGSQ